MFCVRFGGIEWLFFFISLRISVDRFFLSFPYINRCQILLLLLLLIYKTSSENVEKKIIAKYKIRHQKEYENHKIRYRPQPAESSGKRTTFFVNKTTVNRLNVVHDRVTCVYIIFK